MLSLSKVAVRSALLLSLFGCSSKADESDPFDDPSSRESLRKAEPLAHSCQYSEVSRSHVYDSSFEDSTPRCKPGSCDDVKSPSSDYYLYDGYGSVLSSSTTYDNFVDSLGTCDDPQPISCKGRKPVDACEACVIEIACAALIICESDPNCTAIGDCFEYCQDDESCTQRCLSNAEPSGRGNLEALAKAVSRCGACQ